MAFNMLGAVTGAAIIGLTSPTYTLTADFPSALTDKQSYVSALGGTQTGVSTHSVAKPFTVTVRRPSLLKVLANAMWNGVALQWTKVPTNSYKVIFRKGINISAGQTLIAVDTYESKLFAGQEVYEVVQLAALRSFSAGFLWANAQGFYDAEVTGVV